MNDSRTVDRNASSFLTEPLGNLLWKNAAPAVTAMLVFALYQIVDGMMVGRRLGPDALAAVNIIYPVIALFVGLAVMIGVGGNARIALLMGAGKTCEARRVLSLLVTLGGVTGVTGTAVVLLMGEALTTALGAEQEVKRLALVYLGTMAPFFGAYILSFILEQAARNDGKPGLAGAVMAGTAVLNIGLDYLFLFVLDLGIGGAALASGLSISLGASIYVGYFLLKRLQRRNGLRFARPTFDPATMTAIVANGSSELFSALALGIITLLFNRSLMHHIGSLGVAAFAMSQYLLMLGAVFFNGLSAGAQPILGYNCGAGAIERVRGTLIRLLGAGLVVSCALVVVGRAAAGGLAALFVPDHPEAVSLARTAMRVVAWSMIPASVGTLAAGFFTSIERPAISLMIAAGRALVLPGIALTLLPALFGGEVIWWVPVAAETAAALLAGGALARWSVGREVNREPAGLVVSLEPATDLLGQ